MKKYFLIMCLSLIATGQALSQITPVNIGSSANSGGGDPLRTWAIKYNQADFTLDQKGTASGTDTYTVTIAAPAPGFTTGISALSSYATGQRFFITFTNANTGAATLNVNSLGAKSIVKQGSSALSSNDIRAGQTLALVYDGTNMQIIGDGGSVAGAAAWSEITGKPTTIAGFGITDGVTLTGSQTLTNKTLTSPAITTPTGIVKGDVGLGNVDNTSDANKPVSTATQTALDLKANLASPTFTGTPAAPTASAATSTTQLATTAFVHSLIVPVSSSGTSIAFDVPRTYGYSSAETGNITLNATGLREGVTQLIIHNNGTEPTFGAEFTVIGGTYATGEANYIFCHAVKSNLILVTISQAQ